MNVHHIVCPEKPVEDMLLVFGWYAHPVVHHAYGRPAIEHI